MLKPGSIPNREPEIRVGIVLPEDNCTEITINIPAEPDYFIISENQHKYNLNSGDEVLFTANKNQCSLFVNSGKIDTGKIWKIIPKDDIIMNNKTGVKVNNVVSGRSFHWEKKISIYLAGIIEVKGVEGNLVLINDLPLEEYLMCVATSEMGQACPRELIESQTIAARSWMLANVEMKHVDLGFDVCNDDCCQRYQGTTFLSEQSVKGALNTRGKVLMYNNQICDARYSKSCGGVMETFENIWEDTPLDYMQPIPDGPKDFENSNLPLNSEEKVKNWLNSTPETFCSPKIIPEDELQKYLGSVDEKANYFRWTFNYSQDKITKMLNEKCDLQAENIIDIIPMKRGYSGRLTEIKIIYSHKEEKKEYILKDQYNIRAAFHDSFLYSSAFIVEKDDNQIPKEFVLKGGGWGHGAGYCQIGAVGMALKGYSTEDILYHYFPGSELKRIYK